MCVYVFHCDFFVLFPFYLYAHPYKLGNFISDRFFYIQAYHFHLFLSLFNSNTFNLFDHVNICQFLCLHNPGYIFYPDYFQFYHHFNSPNYFFIYLIHYIHFYFQKHFFYYLSFLHPWLVKAESMASKITTYTHH